MTANEFWAGMVLLLLLSVLTLPSITARLKRWQQLQDLDELERMVAERDRQESRNDHREL